MQLFQVVDEVAMRRRFEQRDSNTQCDTRTRKKHIWKLEQCDSNTPWDTQTRKKRIWKLENVIQSVKHAAWHANPQETHLKEHGSNRQCDMQTHKKHIWKLEHGSNMQCDT